MRCISPITLKQDGFINHVPCGRCFACHSNRRQSWLFRLSEEKKRHSFSYFITLTYSDENLPVDNGVPHVSSRDLQLFFKRLRHNVHSHVSYYAVSEYGSHTLRPHYHAIVFCEDNPRDFRSAIERSWRLGFNYIGDVNEKTIRYVTKYVTLRTRLPECYRYGSPYAPFVRCSRGLGENWLTPSMSRYLKHKLDYSVIRDGKRVAIPRYYRDKVFNKCDQAYMKAKFQRDYYRRESMRLSQLSDEEILAEVHNQVNALNLWIRKCENNLYKNRSL